MVPQTAVEASCAGGEVAVCVCVCAGICMYTHGSSQLGKDREF